MVPAEGDAVGEADGTGDGEGVRCVGVVVAVGAGVVEVGANVTPAVAEGVITGTGTTRGEALGAGIGVDALKLYK